jgi:hypothetical protein
MNGYFNNLAIRTVNHGNLVQPRTLSVFEPQGALATDYRNETGSVDSNPVSNLVPATQHATINPPEKVVATEASSEPTVSTEEESAVRIFEETPQHTEPETRVAPAVPVKTTHVPTAPPPLASVKEVLVHENATAIELPQTAGTAVANTATKKTTVPQSQLVEPQRIEPDAQEVFHAAQPERSVSPLIKSVIHETETVRSALHFTEHLTQRTSRTERTKRTQPTQPATQSKQTISRREQLFLESSTDPEPSINITIGRVEVRATPTNAQKQKPTRTASPVMPLEEYLRKQRRGDER